MVLYLCTSTSFFCGIPVPPKVEINQNCSSVCKIFTWANLGNPYLLPSCYCSLTWPWKDKEYRKFYVVQNFPFLLSFDFILIEVIFVWRICNMLLVPGSVLTWKHSCTDTWGLWVLRLLVEWYILSGWLNSVSRRSENAYPIEIWVADQLGKKQKQGYLFLGLEIIFICWI